jgi:16S rRNA G1207 methylase RsmC
MLRPSSVIRTSLVIALLAILPAAAQAQQQQPPPAEQTVVTRELITTYAQAFLKISAARDEAQAELAQARNKTPEAQQHLQDRLRTRVEEILNEHELTEAQYRRLTWLVSAEPEQKKLFEEIVAALTRRTETR